MIVNHNEQLLQNSALGDVIIWDETLRDGEQSPGVAFTLEEKIAIAELMAEMGVGIIDVGFPVVSKEEQETVKTINNLGLKSQIGVTLRAKKEDIDCALDCGIYSGFIFAPTSELHIKHKFNMDIYEFKELVIKTIEYALNQGMDVYFISEDTSRSAFDYIIPYFNELYSMGVDKIMITDTVGTMLPTTMKNFVTFIREQCHPGIKFGIHAHSDFGLATANTLAAIEAGVVLPTVTVNGIGERAGNASFEETVMALEQIYKFNTGINLKLIKELSRMVERFSGLPVAPNKAIVGYNAFRHESGIHVHGMMKSQKTYESVPPELLGEKHQFILGKHSGRNLIRKILQEKGIENETAVQYLTDQIKKMGYQKELKENMHFKIQNYYKKALGVTEDDLLQLIPLELHEEIFSQIESTSAMELDEQ